MQKTNCVLAGKFSACVIFSFIHVYWNTNHVYSFCLFYLIILTLLWIHPEKWGQNTVHRRIRFWLQGYEDGEESSAGGAMQKKRKGSNASSQGSKASATAGTGDKQTLKSEKDGEKDEYADDFEEDKTEGKKGTEDFET